MAAGLFEAHQDLGLRQILQQSRLRLQRLVKACSRDQAQLEKAAAMLMEGEAAVSVAFAVGFSSQSYFTTCFKAQFGVTPGDYGQREATPQT